MKVLKFLYELTTMIFKGKIALALYSLSRRMPSWFLRYNRAWIMAVDKFEFPAKSYDHVNVYIGGIKNIEDILRISGTGREYNENLIKCGARCYLSASNGNPPESVAWAVTGNCYIRGMGFEYDFGYNNPYYFGAVTIPEARGKGLHMASAVRLARDYFNDGASRIYCLIEFTNQFSYELRLKTGFKTIIQTTFIRIFKLKFNFSRNLERS